MVEACNPRHAHEWQVWQEVKLPPGKVLIAGVIDTTTNFVEHPELVVQRIEQFAREVWAGRTSLAALTVDSGPSPEETGLTQKLPGPS